MGCSTSVRYGTGGAWFTEKTPLCASTALLLRHSCATEIRVVAVARATTYYVGGAGGGGANYFVPLMRH